MSLSTTQGIVDFVVDLTPPESAMGGKVSAKANLYFIGAILNEMMAGRRPLIDDDSVSVIKQHINTPLVSPTWHRADLPPALATLVMRLLEKDHNKRPQSVIFVLQTLVSIWAGRTSKEPAKEASTITENPIYRKVCR